MRIVEFCGRVLSLHLFLCAQSLPVPDRSFGTRLQVLDRSTGTRLQGPPQNPQVLLKNQQDQLKSTLGPRNRTEFWARPHCGVPDDPVTKQRQKRFALFGGRWDKTDLTYRITRFPRHVSEDKVRSVFSEAFGVWSHVTPLRFREVLNEDADIIIDFNRFWHGDDLPFDGPGGVLAHAYFPRSQKEGEVHFDYDESWTAGGNSVGTDLLQVAAHEFGHVLGLQHSLEPGAVMCPFYSDTYPLQLSEDDKRGIQYLYGPPLHTPPDGTQTNDIHPELPDACRTSFDAVSLIRGELFFFKDQYVWRVREGRLQAGYPALSSRHWRGFPDYIDAAYEDKSGNIWFFQADSYWVFDAERKISGPDPVQSLGLPVTDIHAALRWDDDHVEKAFLFKSPFYWTFMVQENQVSDSHPHSVHELAGLPSSIDAAFLDRSGYANFLSGLSYWKFDPVALKVLEGYPRTTGTDFFRCSS
ncbi:stromelysin-3 isoform X2 [Austrofundulus limnaeus]|uniref:Stromelysin-3 isoform X2 n=1 Tax=Austrofundulus limnaeus TaxID=52670 RepID=A0A2I4CSR6_AUSLI|nr:PREDICTED: stromelysin-3-like isoform X2 [Austrofundulus limnaeus]